MSVQSVREYLKPFGLDEAIREFSVSSATVELAAAAVGVEPARIAKTLSFFFPPDEQGCLLIVAAGDKKIDNKAFKAQFGFKAKMLPHDLALQLTGHAVGGVCPFALPDHVHVYLDRSLCRFFDRLSFRRQCKLCCRDDARPALPLQPCRRMD